MRRKTATIALFLLLSCSAYAQESLQDTVIRVKRPVNDYWSVGVQYGVTMSRMIFNPSSNPQTWLVSPNTVSVLFSKYCKMFGYMPYFGVEFGFSYGHQGFCLKQEKEEDAAPNVFVVATEGDLNRLSQLTQEKFTVLKIPARAKFHVDVNPVSFTANLGCYAGYRTSVVRSGPVVDESIAGSFMSTDRRFDYGMEGGVGVGVLFDPVEIHLGVLAGWSWNSLFEPNTSPSVNREYYYRFANPLDITFNFGISIQLTKRNGRTLKELKKAAYDQVYGNASGESGQ